MTASYVQIGPDSTGKKLDTENLTVGLNDVHRQRTLITGAAELEIANVRKQLPLGDDYALAVRQLSTNVMDQLLREARTQTSLLRALLIVLGSNASQFKGDNSILEINSFNNQ